MNKDQNLPNKNYQSNNSSGKPLPDSYNNYRSQSPYQNIFRRRSPDRTNSQSYSQNRYRDQIIRIINIEIITQDQTQLEVIFRTIIVIVRIHTSEQKLFQRPFKKFIIQSKVIQTMETKIIRIIDHGFTLTIHHITTITIIDPELTLGIETTPIPKRQRN